MLTHMTSSPHDVASRFVTARRSQTQIDPPQCEQFYDLQGAYLVQRLFAEQYSSSNRRQVGYKLTATDEHSQTVLGLTEPLVGVLFDDDIVFGTGDFPASRFHNPMAEAEIAFIVTRDLPEICSREMILESTEVAPAIEFADSRLLGWPANVSKYSVQDIVADNVLSGGLVVGESVPAADIELPRVRAELTSGGQVLASTSPGKPGVDVVGLIGWLARTLHLVGGQMKAGTVVATGALAGPVPFGCGSITATLDGLGSVSARLTD